jgi:hypothetical protein
MATHLQEIKQCVTFIFVEDGKNGFIANGTGFFVGVQHPTDRNTYTPYLVTAKHVLQNKQGKLFPEIAIRLNKRDGTSKLITIKLGGKTGAKVHFHEDNDVDIALFNCLPDQSIYEFKFIQDSLIATQQIVNENYISEGDDIFFSGLFTSHVGQKRNQPIIRFGKVALMPEDKVEWKEAGKAPAMLDLYLLESQSFGGNSGSPVFFQLNPLRKFDELRPSQIFLAGVMQGSFLNANEVQVVETDRKAISLQNIGIAAVVPAYKLHELLFSENLSQERSSFIISETSKK